ncbi:lysine N(6)-hydroxylase/L-ornithine N(5)-oxygenase family protein [Kitasatospora aureofaciens]|uniref:lysine N(6)-hydroxylase/L-ornithine N(5)-oxygenase family protein n=1 Tax=Kitasatospora aureofaciens TaxID=1894 RepID=UPI001C4406B2|nr:SidA/IucD/PvdA family monooxygenase [Kitasatospora aureofaciens]MBV6696716.1 SidA/IucD/PvdA family monooxygenase [Kitasatospora aureofaciens]
MSTSTSRPVGLPHYAVAGIGAGPANLSFAALAEGAVPGPVALFDRRQSHAWHPELMHPGVRLQTSWVKDLVTLVDPRNRFSFLNYLVTTGRIYAFLNAQFDAIPRLEYDRYLAWASGELGTIRYGVDVTGVRFDEVFVLLADDRPVATSDHLVLGLGTRPYVPDCFADPGLPGVPLPGVLLAEQLAEHFAGCRPEPHETAVVVGGGQTGAEAVLSLLRLGLREIRWIGRRPWFAPMDDSPPANDFYRPAYVRHFQSLPAHLRDRFVSNQILTSDGVSMTTLQELYQVNYEIWLADGRSPVMMLPGRDVVGAAERHGSVVLRCRRLGGGQEQHSARHVVLATGRRPAPLPLAPELLDLAEGEEPAIEPDYSLRWKHGDTNRIFVQNRAQSSHGVVDPNLSLLSVRSAVIINSLLDRSVFSIRDEQVHTLWA